jgi:hypothetical protein
VIHYANLSLRYIKSFNAGTGQGVPCPYEMQYNNLFSLFAIEYRTKKWGTHKGCPYENKIFNFTFEKNLTGS